MNTQTVRLIDASRKVLAVAEVADKGNYYDGRIDLHKTPADLRALFEEFEEIVNGQMFSFLDEIQEKIGSLPIKAVLDNGQEAAVTDLQVFPSTGGVSFKLSEAQVSSARSA